MRRRVDGDLAACVALAEQVDVRDGYPPRRPRSWQSFVARPGALGAWVAVDDGAVVGHVALHPDSSAEVMALATRATGREPDQLAVVARLLVAPEHRRRGIASALLSTAVEGARTAGRRPVLDVAAHFTGAIALYEHAGWRRVGEVTARIGDTEPLREVVFVAPETDG